MASSAASKINEAVNVAAKCTPEDIDVEMFGIAEEDRVNICKRFEELVDESPCYREGDTEVRLVINAPTFVSECVR